MKGGSALVNLTRASKELFSRSEDQRMENLDALWQYCLSEKNASVDRWKSPADISITSEDRLLFDAGNDGAYLLNDWSFSQLCRLAGVAKDTVNRLSPETASRVFRETMPGGTKPLQVLTNDDTVRSIHGTQYTRLWNLDIVAMLKEFAVDFEPPQKGFNGGTGLYAGEQDMFAFMIDPTGWTEIGGENFCPGFFVWNSEVGRRSLGVECFWLQAVCQNHIVWGATEVETFTRKHTASVHSGLAEIRQRIESLVQRRDERKDGFAAVIKKAMESRLGDSEEAMKFLTKNGITRSLAKEALKDGQEKGIFTIWSVVDSLTRLARSSAFAGARVEADEKAGSLLALA